MKIKHNIRQLLSPRTIYFDNYYIHFRPNYGTDLNFGAVADCVPRA